MIPVFKPSHNHTDVEAVAEVLLSGWTGLGPKTNEFERLFTEYVNATYGIALNSCTAALHLALKALGVGDSRDVLVPAITFVSTAHAVEYVGANPIFVDVEPDTLCMSFEDMLRKETENTQAVIMMHYGGHPCDKWNIINHCLDKRILMIEDAAHACGSAYYSEYSGATRPIGHGDTDATCFSFHSVKNLACGDGGMVTTPHREIAEKIRSLRWLGINKNTHERMASIRPAWYYEVEQLGYKYHMNDINAAIALVQLSRLDEMNAKRRAIAAMYDSALADVEWLHTPTVKDYAMSSRHNYACKLAADVDRDAFVRHMSEKGVSVGVHYMPIYMHPYYRGRAANCPVADAVWQKIVLLPIFPDLDVDDQDRVIAAVKAFQA